MNKIIIPILSFLLIACRQQKNEEFSGFKVIEVTMNMNNYVNIHEDKALSDKIIKDLINAEKVKGPIKGIGIEIKLCKNSDTIKIFSYAGREYFRYGSIYYKANSNLLPDSIVSKFIKH
jgi:hypothetical protein